MTDLGGGKGTWRKAVHDGLDVACRESSHLHCMVALLG
jgi:hypothetical protein